MIIDNTFIDYACGLIAGYGYNNGLKSSVITTHLSKFSSKFDTPLKPVHSMAAKKDVLKSGLRCFTSQQQFVIIESLCNMDDFDGDADILELKSELYRKYGALAPSSITSSELVSQTSHWLSNYPEALAQYQSALEKYARGIYERNVLDDMRLSFELLLQVLLNNKKSLENQISELGNKLKTAGVSTEFRNMIMKIIDYYRIYQNDHVKHSASIKNEEIEITIELTSIIMKHLIKVLG